MPYFFYNFTKNLILLFSKILDKKCFPADSKSVETSLLIVAGQGGWHAIDINQLYISSKEYLGDYKVLKLQTNQNKNYVSQLKEYLTTNSNITHILHDPRSSRPEQKQTDFNMYWEGLRLALLFKLYRVTPIVYLTDASFRLWRIQASIVTMFSGIVVTFMSTRKIKSNLPHSRFVGPNILPISIRTLESIVKIKCELVRNHKVENLVRFCGSLYEPRTTFLNSLKKELGDDLSIMAHPIASARVSENEYWRRLASATINITTSFQMENIKTDFPGEKQLVYRYLEVLAAGSLLIAPKVSGITRYFTPGIDFVDFVDFDDAHYKVKYYLSHKNEREKIAQSGFETARRLITSKTFWFQVDCALGTDSLM